MLYCINLIHDGFLAAVLGFLIWSLPGALGMLGLAIGISNIGETLPRPVYALLSGLNAATVGIVALAAVQLAQKAITDKLTRTLVFLGAAAGLLYNALWYFPVLMLIAGIISIIHDFRWLHRPVKFVARIPSKLRGKITGRRPGEPTPEAGTELPERPAEPEPEQAKATSNNVTDAARQRLPAFQQDAASSDEVNSHDSASERVIPPSHRLTALTWQAGVGVIVAFLVSFVVIVALRGALDAPPLLYRLFANLYLAGTIIFGGGPVVIPLLREYIVFEGWVSPRDFLIGLALIQSFPGPNFNFAVYLGALTASNFGHHPALGALLGFLGIFLPGLITVHGTMGVWGAIRNRRTVKSALRGVNAAAVGLIYTAVYRLWGIGWIDEGFVQGKSLAEDPWWVVVTATSYVGGAWYGVSPPVAIVLGAVLGLIRYAVVDA
ncbi:chromate transporter-domain-containing protein [Podospora aff. communis PSN243]|uniref:Chromate transporter-domain-containing protein n=1 Tax=Podospora aff. communis PSN243 TaxID=3040156 RepID=A0AAV9GUD9_9PEZI|nr:chromate transporter-domain-containing protein [Podospora aff. communis PSN243]